MRACHVCPLKKPAGCCKEQTEDIVDQQSLRDAMSCMGAAVNIITTDGPAGRAGFTASAVCSVTDTPPTLLVCLIVGRPSGRYSMKIERCVNTLSAGQEPLSNLFGGKTPMEHRFAAARWQTGVTGCPQLEEALVSFDCRISQVVTSWHPRHSVLRHRSNSSSRHTLRAGVVRSQLSRADAPCLLTS